MEPSRISDTIRPEVESSTSKPLSDAQLSSRVREKLEELDDWRVNASQLRIAADGRRIEGGFAVIFRGSLIMKSSDLTGAAVDTDTGVSQQRDVDVAVKMMKIKKDDDIHQVLKRTVREANMIAHLDHENIIKLQGFVEDLPNRNIWLIFTWAEMGTVRDFVGSKDWSVPERIGLIYDVACGVKHLHSQEPPICHGDLKSINILVNSESRAIITDFGSARRCRNGIDEGERKPAPARRTTADKPTLSVEFSQDSNTMTFTGTKYTLRWVAPEVLEEEDAGTAADIWSMAWVFYEIMTGSIPFENLRKDSAIILHIMKGELPSLKDHDRMSPILSLVSLMVMCWDVSPENRPSAERCEQYIFQMPKCVPRSKESSDTVLGNAERLLHEGNMYRLQNDYDKALAAFNDALLVLGDEALRTKEGANILRGIAECHRLRDEYEEAIALYSKSVGICKQIGARAGAADAQWGLAEVHRARDEYDEAAALYSEALKIREEIGDRRGKADAQWGLAHVHRARDEYDEAAALYVKAVQTYQEMGDRRGTASAQWGLAEVHRARDEYSEAAALYAKVVQIREEIGDRRGKADAQWGLAEVYRARDECDDAAALYVEAILIYEAFEDRRGIADAQWGLAEVHRARDEYDEAAALYTKVFQIREEIGDRNGTSDAQWGLAEIHRGRQEHDQAAALYAEVVRICNEIGDRRGKADAQWGLAEVHRARGEYNEAAALYTKALKIREEIGDRKGKAEAQYGIAQVHRARNEYEEAESLFSEAARACEVIGDRGGRARILAGLATVHRARKEYEKSLQLFMESSQLCRAYGNKSGLARGLRGMADVCRDQEHFKDAAKFYEEAEQLFTSIGFTQDASSALECATDIRRKGIEPQE